MGTLVLQNRSEYYHIVVWPLLSVGVIFLTLSVGAISIMCFEAFKICKKTKITLFRSGIRRRKFTEENEDPPETRGTGVSEADTKIPTIKIDETVHSDERNDNPNISQGDLKLSTSPISRSLKISSLISPCRKDTKGRDDCQQLIRLESLNMEEDASSSSPTEGSFPSENEFPCPDSSSSGYSSSLEHTFSKKALHVLNADAVDYNSQDTSCISSIESNMTTSRSISPNLDCIKTSKYIEPTSDLSKPAQYHSFEFPEKCITVDPKDITTFKPSTNSIFQGQLDMARMPKDVAIHTREMLQGSSSSGYPPCEQQRLPENVAPFGLEVNSSDFLCCGNVLEKFDYNLNLPIDNCFKPCENKEPVKASSKEKMYVVNSENANKLKVVNIGMF